MLETTQKRPLLSRRGRVILALVIILGVTVLGLLYGPQDGDNENTTGDVPLGEGTLQITNLVDTVTINRSLEVNGVHMAFTKAMLASAYSDDMKPGGTYTVRVVAQTTYHGRQPVGINYYSLAHLKLPDGSVISTKLISLPADQLPNSPQTGFFDFAVANKVSLSKLTLLFGNQPPIAFR